MTYTKSEIKEIILLKFEYNGCKLNFISYFKKEIKKILKDYYLPKGMWGFLNDSDNEGVINTGIKINDYYFPIQTNSENKEIKKVYINFYGFFDMVWSLLNFLETNYTAITKLINGLNYINKTNPEKIINLYDSDLKKQFIKLFDNIKEHQDKIIYPTDGYNTHPFRDIFSAIIESHTKGEITSYIILKNLESFGYKVVKTLDGQLKDIIEGVDLYLNDKIEVQCKPFSSCTLTDDNRYKVVTSGIKNYRVGMIMAFYSKETNEFLYFKIKEDDMGVNKSKDFCTFSFNSRIYLKHQLEKVI
jgi:hypothetical protein